MSASIEKYFKINTTQDALRQELLEFDTWTQWWPGVTSVNVVENQPQRVVLDMVFNVKITINLRLEIDPSNESQIKFKQLNGWFKAYAGDWTMLQPPDGVGVTLKSTTVFDVGMMVPKSMVHAKLSESMDELEGALNQRLAGKAPAAAPTAAGTEAKAEPGAPAAPQEAEADEFAHVFQTDDGLEIWADGQRYFMKPTK